MKKFASLLLLLLTSFYTAFSQEAPVEMADAFRESGKIYVVVGVLTIILTGIIVYLVILDRKISKVEKSRNGH